MKLGLPERMDEVAEIEAVEFMASVQEETLLLMLGKGAQLLCVQKRRSIPMVNV